MNKILTLFIFITLSQKILAGGYDFEAVVETFEMVDANQGSYTLVLVPESEDSKWSAEQCAKITVVGEYDKSRWSKYKPLISQEKHQESLSYLSDSIGKLISFGVIGSGLKEVEPCQFLSKGLLGNAEVGSVTSIYGRI